MVWGSISAVEVVNICHLNIEPTMRVRWCARAIPWTMDALFYCLRFSDESHFNLLFSDGRVRVWRIDEERHLGLHMGKKGGATWVF